MISVTCPEALIGLSAMVFYIMRSRDYPTSAALLYTFTPEREVTSVMQSRRISSGMHPTNSTNECQELLSKVPSCSALEVAGGRPKAQSCTVLALNTEEAGHNWWVLEV